MRPTRAPNPSPLAGEAGRERSEWPGEGPREPAPLRIAAAPRPSPATRTLRVRAASSPAGGEGKRSAKSQMRQRSRALRARMTDAERKLWFALRDRRFAGFKFRRQVPIDRFIADFVCFDARLIIEVDGGQHAGSLQDRRRDRWFAANGFRVVRFWNNEVLSNLEGVLTALSAELGQRR
jgi:very-short-patch-repair endonuclease